MIDTCRYKKKLAWCLIGSMLLGMPNTNVQAMEVKSRFSDIKGHWAEQAIDRMSSYQIINGYNGLFRPNDLITRGEMAITIDGIMKYQKESENTFMDVEEVFYKDAILKAYEEGLLLENNGFLRPRDYATREEVAYMIYNAFDIEKSDEPITFVDEKDISSWSQEAVASLVAKGMIVGSDGKFRPKEPITRAEVVTILNRLLGDYYNTEGTYNGYIEGTVVVNTSDANLKDMIISGDLIIAEGVAEGDIILEDVIVRGRTIIRGGGIHSIKVKGHSKLSNVVMAKDDSPVRLVVEESAQVNHVTVTQDAADVIVAGTLEKVVFEAGNRKLTVQDGKIEELNITGENANIQLKGKTDIKMVDVSEQAIDTQITVEKDAKVKEINAQAKATIDGKGQVAKVNANASHINVQTKDTKVVAAKGTTGVIAGKELVKGGTTSNTTKPSYESNSSGGSSGSGSTNNGNNSINKPEEKPLSITKIETVRNGLVRFELSEALDTALTLDKIYILCTSGGKDMTILDVTTSDNKVYELTTSYFDDNTYRLYVYLEDNKLIEKDFVSKYDCAEISSIEITRTSSTTATLSYVSDVPGKFYYGLGKKDILARASFTKEPTAEELIEQGVESTMDLHLNTLQIEGLEEGEAYNLYYVAVDTTNRITPVKSISIPGEVVQEPSKNEIKIEEATPYYQNGDLFDENYYFVFKLSEPTKTTLRLDQFEIICPLDGKLSLGRVESEDNQTYTVYMKKGYVPKERNTFKVTISFDDGTTSTKGFYVDLTAPIIKNAKVMATTSGAIQVELESDEPGKLYYKILDYVEDDISAKDPSDIYKTGTQVEIGYGLNILKDIPATEGKWFCYATEDKYGNRQPYYGYKQVPQYVAPEEPEQPDENPVAITEIVCGSGWSGLTVSFNQYVADARVDKSNISITGLSGKLLTSVRWSGEKLVIEILNYNLQSFKGEHTLRLIIDNKVVEGIFTVN